MKILNIGHFYHVKGGSDRYMMSMEKLLQEHGHEVIPFAGKDEENEPTPYSNYFPVAGDVTPSQIMRIFYNREAARNLNSLITDVQPDMAHMHIYYAKLSASILPVFKKRNLPVVQTMHEYKAICPVYTLYRDGHICTDCQGKHFYKAFLNRCNKSSFAHSGAIALQSYIARWMGDVRNVDHFITVSEFQRQQILQFDVLKPEQITTVHNFLDATEYEPGDQPGNYFLYFGRLDKTKGVMTLIQAMKELPDIELRIAGTGPQEEELRSFVEENSLTNVRFLGFRSGADLHDTIRGAIACVIPSEWYETFGLTTIESFALGRPVIGAAIGGITEVISDGKDGLLFESGNMSQLREKISWMAAQPQETLVAMGQHGRKKVETQFGREKHYENLSAVYDKILH